MALFKIDSYYATIRGQPSHLRPEEMHFTLTVTYSLWSQKAIGSLELFKSAEPFDRSQTTIAGLSRSPLECKELSPFITFPEDVQVCICSLQSEIWEFVETSRSSGPDEEAIATKRNL
jgi:hypothetical protein